MESINELLHKVIADGKVLGVAHAFIILLVGYFVARLLAATASKILSTRFELHETQLVRRGVFYTLFILFLITALNQLGFRLGVLLGAAGVFSVAIGFASQTSVSNLISGLFLLGEKPFRLGDVIRVGNTVGEVLSVDLLSVKLRTFENLFVRIPNESLIKSEVTTLTKFPIRRIDLKIGIAYKENISQVRDILNKVAEKNPLCMEEPKPLFIFLGFGESSLDIQFSVWAQREHFLDLKNSIHEEIKMAFDEEGIEIPFPHRTLYTGSATEPFPIAFQGRTDIHYPTETKTP